MLAGELLGRTARGLDGTPLGRIADVLTQPDQDGRPQVTAVLIVRRGRARLFGYERPGLQRPRILDKLVQLVHRGMTEIPVEQIQWPPSGSG
jgi:hypothetical protein